MTQPGLGRIQYHDPRSRNYSINALTGTQTPRSKTWECKLQLDQGETSACVANAIAHEIAAKPTTANVPIDEPWAQNLYHQAQANDHIDGPHDGTTVLAGMKTAQTEGYYGQYRWAFNTDDLILAIGYHGPAIIGINWYIGMMDTTPNGYVHPIGDLVGGHAVLLRAVHIGPAGDYFIIHNSWGPNWGNNGEAFISVGDMHKLLHQGGEACIPVVRKSGPPSAVQQTPRHLSVR